MSSTNGTEVQVVNLSAIKVRPEHQVFTMGGVGRICKVANRTAAKWFDSGRLKGYRIPGSQDRRVPRHNLVRFLKEHGMPVPADLEVGRRILLVGVRPDLAERLDEQLLDIAEMRMEQAPSILDAGMLLRELSPDTVVTDVGAGRAEALRVATVVRRDETPTPGKRGVRRAEPTRALLVALVYEDEANGHELTAAGFDHVLVMPVDVAALAKLVRAGREG